MSDRPADAGCVFCKIVAGQIPCHRVYEDERVLAFLDVSPLAEGHTLIIPKGHYATLDKMSDADAAACAAVLPRLGRAVTAATGAAGWNVLQNNGRVAQQSVDHVHFHIIPRREGDGLGYRWPAGKLSPEAAKGMVEKVKGAL